MALAGRGFRTHLVLICTLLALCGAAPPAAAADLTSAKSLYAAASYEEALAQLNAIRATDNLEQIEQYRALCLLALGRPSDAQKSLERIVISQPLYRMDNADVSPKLATMFQDVRRRMLPSAARELYTKGKTSFDSQVIGILQRQAKKAGIGY